MLVASPVFQEYLAGVAKNHPLPVVGVILGVPRKQSNTPDTIVHLVRLLKEEPEDADGLPESNKDQLVFDVQDIQQMLSPGVDIIGSFVVCNSEDVTKDPEAWDRVKLVFRVVRKLCPASEKHFILVHSLASTPGKTSCLVVKGDKPNLDKNVLEKVSLDFSGKNAQKLVQVNCQFSLTRNTFLGSYDWLDGDRGTMKADRVKEALVRGLEKAMSGALITFNGEIPSPGQKVKDVTQTEAGAGDKGKTVLIVAEIYEKNVPIEENEEVKRSSDLIRLKGCVASRLYVLQDDSLEYVEELLRKDLIQSIKQRIEIGVSANVTDEGSLALHELDDRLGRRVYFTIQPSNIQLFDHLYPQEGQDDLLERINTKLDILVEVTDIYFDLEEDGPGEDSDLIETIAQQHAGHTGKKAATAETTSPLANRKLLMLLLRFVLVAVVAIVLPLIFSKKDAA